MDDLMLYEMASVISTQCGTRLDETLNALLGYWQDKVAHVWRAEDMFEAAERIGKPLLRAEAIELLKSIFDGLDSALGITRQTLEVALEDYHRDFASLSPEKYSEIHGVFKVWREHNPIAHQFGLFPNQVDGNFPPALNLAVGLAREHPGQRVCVACESSTGEETGTWLFVQFENEQITITESEVLNHVRMD